ncbi:MAG: 3-hydroxybutyryl-CoA dehydrogenase, partial [bacterium]|nr:3-hydroxybutyryl-CoA dehydrogenase [bacterium]
MEIKKVGVVGCGLMGGGIAQVCAESGYETIAREINDEFLEKGMNAIHANWNKAVAKKRMTEDDQNA